MPSQTIIDNLKNANTHITASAVLHNQDTQRRVRLAAQIDLLCKNLGFNNPADITSFCLLGMNYLNHRYSAASAFDEVRKSATRLAQELGLSGSPFRMH